VPYFFFHYGSARANTLWASEVVTVTEDRLTLFYMAFAYCVNVYTVSVHTGIGVDLSGLLGGDAWRVPKVGPCRVGWHMGRGVPSPAD